MEEKESLKAEDLVIIEVSEEMLLAADYFAKKRLMFEYPRDGYGDYDETHQENIRNGYLGEFAFFEYIHSFLAEKISTLKPKERYSKLKDYFEYKMIIGKVQPEWDFRLADRLIEVKTYGTKYLKRLDQVFDYNLLIDKDQVKEKSIPDIYVQCFLLKIQNKTKCILAGYNEGLPKQINSELPKPAYYISVKNLKPMRKLLETIII